MCFHRSYWICLSIVELRKSVRRPAVTVQYPLNNVIDLGSVVLLFGVIQSLIVSPAFPIAIYLICHRCAMNLVFEWVFVELEACIGHQLVGLYLLKRQDFPDARSALFSESKFALLWRLCTALDAAFCSASFRERPKPSAPSRVPTCTWLLNRSGSPWRQLCSVVM